MSRFFSASASLAVGQWFGFSLENLPPTWKAAIELFTRPGGSAEEKLGPIKSVTIRYITTVI